MSTRENKARAESAGENLIPIRYYRFWEAMELNHIVQNDPSNNLSCERMLEREKMTIFSKPVYYYQDSVAAS